MTDLIGGFYGGQQQDDLVDSQTNYMIMKQKMQRIFTSAWGVYKEIYEQIMKVNSQQNLDLLSRMVDAQTSENIYQDFIYDKYLELGIPQSAKFTELKDLVKQLKNSKEPINLNHITLDLENMRQKLYEKKQQQTKLVSSSQFNDGSELLKNIVSGISENGRSIYDILNKNDIELEKQAEFNINKKYGNDVERLAVVKQFYNNKRRMLADAISFCEKVEKELRKFIINFNRSDRESYQKKVRSLFTKYKPQLKQFVVNSAITVTGSPEGTNDNCDSVIQLQAGVKKFAQLVVGNYINNNSYGPLMGVLEEISNVQIDGKQLLTKLIAPSIIYSQLRLQTQKLDFDAFSRKMTGLFNKHHMLYSQFDIDGTAQPAAITATISESFLQYLNSQFNKSGAIVVQAYNELLDKAAGLKTADQLTNTMTMNDGGASMTAFKKLIREFHNKIKHLIQDRVMDGAYALSGAETIQQTTDADTTVVFMGKIRTALSIQEDAGGDVVVTLKHVTPPAPMNNATNIGAMSAIYKLDRITQPQQTAMQQKQIDDSIKKIYDILIKYNKITTQTNIDGIMKLDGDTTQAGVDVDVINAFTSADEGDSLQLVYDNSKDSVLLKLCSQTIDAIFGSLFIDLQQYQLDQQEITIADQLRGGGGYRKVQKEKVIDGAEMFYQLFQGVIKQTYNMFNDQNRSGQEFKFVMKLNANSPFKIAFDHVTSRDCEIKTIYDFLELTGYLNVIWESSNEPLTQLPSGLNKRTVQLLQSFINDLMQGLQYQRDDGLKNSVINGISTYKSLLRTSGFSDDLNNINTQSVRADEFVDGIELGIDTEKTSYNERYLQLVNQIEQLLLKQDSVKDDSKQFKFYVDSYYKHIDYKDKRSRQTYVFKKFTEFNEMKNDQMEQPFINEFGALYYYFFLYVSNVIKVLNQYYLDNVHNRIIDAQYRLDADGNVTTEEAYKYAVPSTQHDMKPMDCAYLAATFKSQDEIFKRYYDKFIQTRSYRFYEQSGEKRVEKHRQLENDNELQNLVTPKQIFHHLCLNYGPCAMIEDRSITAGEGHILPERLDQLHEQYNYMFDNKEKLIAYVLENVLATHATATLFFSDSELTHKMFTLIDKDTIRIGKIVMTIKPDDNDNRVNFVNGKTKTVFSVVANNIYETNPHDAADLGADNYLKLQLNQQFENIIINGYAPPYIYPFSAEEHQSMVQQLTQNIPLITYAGKQYNHEKLLSFIDTIQKKLLEKYQMFASQGDLLNNYYKNQLKMSTDVSQFINAIMTHKIIAPVPMDLFEQNHRRTQGHDYEKVIRYRFQNEDTDYKVSSGSVYEDLFSYKNTYKMEVEGGLPGFDHKEMQIQSRMMNFDEVVSTGHSNILFSVTKTNQILTEWLKIFSIDGSYSKLPRSIIDQLMQNQTIRDQSLMKSVEYQDFTVMIPEKGFQTPFTLPIIGSQESRQEDLAKLVQYDDKIVGGARGGARGKTKKYLPMKKVEPSELEANVKYDRDILAHTIPRSNVKLVTAIKNITENSKAQMTLKQLTTELTKTSNKYDEFLQWICVNKGALNDFGLLLCKESWKYVSMLRKTTQREVGGKQILRGIPPLKVTDKIEQRKHEIGNDITMQKEYRQCLICYALTQILKKRAGDRHNIVDDISTSNGNLDNVVVDGIKLAQDSLFTLTETTKIDKGIEDNKKKQTGQVGQKYIDQIYKVNEYDKQTLQYIAQLIQNAKGLFDIPEPLTNFYTSATIDTNVASKQLIKQADIGEFKVVKFDGAVTYKCTDAALNNGRSINQVAATIFMHFLGIELTNPVERKVRISTGEQEIDISYMYNIIKMQEDEFPVVADGKHINLQAAFSMYLILQLSMKENMNKFISENGLLNGMNDGDLRQKFDSKQFSLRLGFDRFQFLTQQLGFTTFCQEVYAIIYKKTNDTVSADQFNDGTWCDTEIAKIYNKRYAHTSLAGIGGTAKVDADARWGAFITSYFGQLRTTKLRLIFDNYLSVTQLCEMTQLAIQYGYIKIRVNNPCNNIFTMAGVLTKMNEFGTNKNFQYGNEQLFVERQGRLTSLPGINNIKSIELKENTEMIGNYQELYDVASYIVKRHDDDQNDGNGSNIISLYNSAKLVLNCKNDNSFSEQICKHVKIDADYFDINANNKYEKSDVQHEISLQETNNSYQNMVLAQFVIDILDYQNKQNVTYFSLSLHEVVERYISQLNGYAAVNPMFQGMDLDKFVKLKQLNKLRDVNPIFYCYIKIKIIQQDIIVCWHNKKDFDPTEDYDKYVPERTKTLLQNDMFGDYSKNRIMLVVKRNDINYFSRKQTFVDNNVDDNIIIKNAIQTYSKQLDAVQKYQEKQNTIPNVALALPKGDNHKIVYDGTKYDVTSNVVYQKYADVSDASILYNGYDTIKGAVDFTTINAQNVQLKNTLESMKKTYYGQVRTEATHGSQILDTLGQAQDESTSVEKFIAAAKPYLQSVKDVLALAKDLHKIAHESIKRKELFDKICAQIKLINLGGKPMSPDLSNAPELAKVFKTASTPADSTERGFNTKITALAAKITGLTALDPEVYNQANHTFVYDFCVMLKEIETLSKSTPKVEPDTTDNIDAFNVLISPILNRDDLIKYDSSTNFGELFKLNAYIGIGFSTKKATVTPYANANEITVDNMMSSIVTILNTTRETMDGTVQTRQVQTVKIEIDGQKLDTLLGTMYGDITKLEQNCEKPKITIVVTTGSAAANYYDSLKQLTDQLGKLSKLLKEQQPTWETMHQEVDRGRLQGGADFGTGSVFLYFNFVQGQKNRPTVQSSGVALYIDQPVQYSNPAMQEIMDKQRAEDMVKTLLETSKELFIYDTKSNEIVKFNPQQEKVLEEYQGQLIYMSNVYAMNKSKEIEYSLTDLTKLASQIINKQIIQRIDQLLLGYTVSPNAKGVLQTLKQIAVDVIKKNWQRLQTEQEYRQMYDDYMETYNKFIKNNQELFDVDKILKEEDSRLLYWMTLESQYGIDNDQLTHLGEYGLVKQILFQLIKIRGDDNKIKIDKTSFQRNKLLFNRYVCAASPIIGQVNHFVPGEIKTSLLENVIEYGYVKYLVDNERDTKWITQVSSPEEQAQWRTDFRQNVQQIFKLSKHIDDMSQEMHKLVRMRTYGMKIPTNFKSVDYCHRTNLFEHLETMKLTLKNTGSITTTSYGTNGATVVNTTQPSAAIIGDFSYMPFTTMPEKIYNSVGPMGGVMASSSGVNKQEADKTNSYIELLNENNKMQPVYVNMKDYQIFLHNMLYEYGSVDTNNNQLINRCYPLVATLHLQINSGATHPDILIPSTTFGLSIIPQQTTTSEQYAAMQPYFNNLYNMFHHKEITKLNSGTDKKNDMGHLFSIIGLNPINSLSLIKKNINYQVINVLALYFNKFMKDRYGNSENDAIKQYIKTYFDQVDNKLVPKMNIQRDITDSMIHISASFNAYKDLMVDKNKMGQNMKEIGYKITINPKQQEELDQQEI